MLRVEEMNQSLRIIEQALDRLEPGPVMVEDAKIAWPAKLSIGADGMGNSLDHVRKIMGQSMESLIHHFKLVTEGFKVPPGQAYVPIESPRGELGAHLVSDGGTRPLRVHLRDPSFVNLQAAPAMSEGGMVSDVIAALASLDPVMGGVTDEPRSRTRGAGGSARRARARDRRGRRHHRAARRAGLGRHTVFDGVRDRATAIVARYPQPRSALLPLLHLVQHVEGHVSRAGIAFCAEVLEITTAEVSAVATFYTMYKREPVGRHLVSVCTNTLCAALGGDDIYAAVRERPRRVGHEQTSADGTATIEHAECLAACDLAPVLTVDYEFFDKQTVESAVEIIEALQRGEKPHPTRGAPLNDFRSVELLLAGFFDDPAVGGLAAVAGPSAAEESAARRPARRGARLDRATRCRTREAPHDRPAHPGPDQALARPRVLDAAPLHRARWLRGAAHRARDPARRPRRAGQGLRPARPRRRRVPDGHEVELHPAASRARRPPARRRSRSTS